MGVILGNGWYNQRDKVNVKLLWYGCPKLLFQIELYYEDETRETVGSDTSVTWQQGVFNIIIFISERYMMHARNCPGENSAV